MATTTKTSLGLDLIDETTERLEDSRVKISANFQLIHDLFVSNTDYLLGAPIASASTTTIGSVGSGDTKHVTGTTTITSFGVSTTGVKKTLIFDEILTITHNATSLMCLGGVNIVTAVGDIAEFQCVDGATAKWMCTSYTRKSGQPLIVPAYAVNGVTLGASTTIEERISTMAGATSITIGAVGTAENLTITGANSISSLGNCLGGVRRKLVFADVNTLVHNATSLILPDGTNIITASGDVAEFLCVSDNNWKLTSYLRATTPASANSIKWNGASKTVSTSAPSGGVDGDIWFQY